MKKERKKGRKNRGRRKREREGRERVRGRRREEEEIDRRRKERRELERRADGITVVRKVMKVRIEVPPELTKVFLRSSPVEVYPDLPGIVIPHTRVLLIVQPV